jgi:FkbM family methyltransferase
MDYEHKSIDYLRAIVSRFSAPVLLIDCGADIGLMSLRLISECPNIKRVIAFEPNPKSFSFLQQNFHFLGIDAEARNQAVSNFQGRAELKHPDFDGHDHAAFIVSSPAGDIDVCTIDSLDINEINCLILKIDVEGEEYSVIQGAVETLARAKNFVVVFEAHSQQATRTHMEPTALIAYLNKIKPCKAGVVEMPDHEIDLNRPFFEQFPQGIFNICVYPE